ncbi:MAG TPA: response regulator [Ignavibacteriaceae bacterium]|nr:response regulator [Ignavibacteriaceae bacterium]
MQRILVIENDTAISIGLKAALELDDFEVISGLNTVGKFQTANPDQIDFIILDVNQPGKNRNELVNEIKIKFADSPMLLIAGGGDQINKAECLKLGAEDFLLKPFSLDELIIRLNTILRGTKRKPMNTDLFNSPTSIS